MAGLAGILFANCVFVSPTMFSLSYAAQVIIWVLVGGLGTLVGPIIGCIADAGADRVTPGTLSATRPEPVLGVVLMLAVLRCRRACCRPRAHLLARTVTAGGGGA